MRNPATNFLQTALPATYFLSLLIPLYSFLFVLNGPHTSLSALAWIFPLWLTVIIDMWSPLSCSQPKEKVSDLLYDAVLYLLAGLQFITILFLLQFAAQLRFANPGDWLNACANLFAIKVIVGTSSSFSGIVVAHELIHRKGRHNRILGRLLLCLECYEHFATEHLHGHHKNFATAKDPATARLGEGYEEFWKRTVPAQFKHAWMLENERLNQQMPGPGAAKFLYHRVVQGLLLEATFLLWVVSVYGLVGLVAFAVQAYAAVRKLEAVNYIEHWGLNRDSSCSRDALSWDTDSWFTLNAIVGLSRHSDHHHTPGKPYHRLNYCAQSPKLPYGYFTSVFLSVFFNRKFQSLARRELDLHYGSPNAILNRSC